MAQLRLAVFLSALTIPTATAVAQRKLDPEKVVQKGCDILLEMQEEQKEWPYEGVYRVAGAIPVGYHVGGTAICGRAMIEAPGYEKHSKRQEAIANAVDFILEQLDEPLMASGFKGRYDVRGWGHTYALQFFLRLDDLGFVPEKSAEAVKAKTQWLIDTLIETEIPEAGGWNYSRGRGFRSTKNGASAFMTAPTLQALFHAKSKGYEIDESVVDRALEALDRSRNKAGNYTYSSSPNRSMHDTEEDDMRKGSLIVGATGRMVVTEATLMLAGRGDADRLDNAVELFFEHWDYLKERKQQHGTHTGPGGVAPYYFMYAHRYAAQAIEMLPEKQRAKQRKRLHKILAKESEKDGGWNDRVFARSRNYGTAFGMLAVMAPDLPNFEWRPGAAASEASGSKDEGGDK